MSTYYDLLDISNDATPSEIRKAYLGLAARCHPDKLPDDPTATAKFQILNEAYTVLSDEEARARYDDKLRALEMEEQARTPSPTRQNQHERDPSVYQEGMRRNGEESGRRRHLSERGRRSPVDLDSIFVIRVIRISFPPIPPHVHTSRHHVHGHHTHRHPPHLPHQSPRSLPLPHPTHFHLPHPLEVFDQISRSLSGPPHPLFIPHPREINHPSNRHSRIQHMRSIPNLLSSPPPFPLPSPPNPAAFIQSFFDRSPAFASGSQWPDHSLPRGPPHPSPAIRPMHHGQITGGWPQPYRSPVL